MTLHLTYHATQNVPLEVEGVLPEVVRDRSVAEIEKLPVFLGNQAGSLGDFFAVSGDPGDERIEWEGDLRGVHWIGAQMTCGEMHVVGDAGRHLGSEMRGGAIHVSGGAGDWVGGEMKGGLIHVRGAAGHLVGAAYRGSARGMTGGTILVQGSAGNEVGHTMRRGLLVIGGDLGDLAGFNMLAGTVLILGKSGIRHGAGMRRGTIGFLGQPPELLLSFRYACRYRPDFLRLVMIHLKNLGFPLEDRPLAPLLRLYHGDLIAGGRGEMLLLDQDP